MTKRSRSLALPAAQNGQISIFFSASLVVLITIIAFVINIGLFVKAKINLQNATDAAAFSGAAVQARQLTTIAYMNWEMRNIYKEWMFKYYVAGNLNVEDVEDPTSGTGAMSFRLRPTTDTLNAKTYQDAYNFPSVCIHLANSQTNLCKRYSIPGLPEFGSSNLPGAEEASRAFINSLIGTKVLDCVDQTRLNMLVNLTWSYNVLAVEGDETLVEQGPQILADRMGAWPKAVEVAMRIRNLEKAVNREAETAGVCAEGNTPEGKVRCGKSIDSIMAEKRLGNERLVKAFYSGYRNLGNQIESEMKQSFTLTEIPPKKPELGGLRSASYLLVPSRDVQNYQKQYLDLHLMMVNLATFYNAFVPRSTSSGVPISGACDVSKVAIPVPGYPMGFYKNPDVLTYYAVRGEAEFEGMFNPFGDGAVKLTAYSAAKPFGGRIGPMLYYQGPNQEFFTGRSDPFKFRSVPYITSVDVTGTTNIVTGAVVGLGDFAPGIPLPVNSTTDTFWLKDDASAVGGYAADVQFGVPNLVYDYQVPFQNTGYTTASDKIHILKSSINKSNDKEIGLYSKFQFNKFKGPNLVTDINQQTLTNEIRRVRAPTLYDTSNYLVPSQDVINQEMKIESVGFVPGKVEDLPNGLKNSKVFIYAPLTSQDQQDVFWRNGDEVVTTVFEYIKQQRPAIDKYQRSMIAAALEIKRQGDNLASEATGAKIGFEKAALGVADIDFPPTAGQKVKTCKSLAGLFLWFYMGDQDLDPSIIADPTGCPQSLGANLRKYFKAEVGGSGFQASHYEMDYTFHEASLSRGKPGLFTAYMPGSYTGASDAGVFNIPIPGVDSNETVRRNFYSTKFVGLGSLRATGPWDETTSNFVMYSEGDLATSPSLNRSQKLWKNPLDAEAIGADISSIQY